VRCACRPAWLARPGSFPTPYFLIQAALPSLRESALKSEVNISSSSGILRLSQVIPHS
jgi:hypothetical protein